MTTASISRTDSGYSVSLADWGPDLSGRTLGASIREEVVDLAPEVLFDCAGVESMSPSFADEVFGKLASSDKRPHINVVNANPAVLSAIRFAVSERTR
jgi:STAS-like domain of unknown function (DUF4325)